MGIFDFIGYGLLARPEAQGENFNLYLILSTLFVAIISYLLGSVNGAVIVSRAQNRRDVRECGSKNAGMTNMMRVYGKKAAFFTGVIDVAKTIVAVFIGCFIGRITFLPWLAGLCCLIGHAFPVFFGFRGGKGVLVGAATMFCMSVPTFVLVMLVWGGTLLFTKYVSVASIIASLVFPFLLDRVNAFFTANVQYYMHSAFDVIFAFVMGATVIFLHRENIKRLKEGNENRIGKKKDKKDGE